MQVQRIVLMRETSDRDIAVELSDKTLSPRISIAFELDAVADKPWPFEFVMTSEVQTSSQTDSSNDDLVPFFTSEHRYAVAFDRNDAAEINASEAAVVIWPYIRHDLLERLRKHEIPPLQIPLRFVSSDSELESA
ncbi:hypothetical protein BEUL_1729 [Bifidobacterium eulemuris]|nr:hypothetical protein BEUL_1729 [Bifidobacterium eulemuris]